MIVDESAHANETEDGENYFISMTDMMVGVLFIFIIMLMVFALDFRTKTDVQLDAIDVAREVARKLEALQSDVRNEIATMDRTQEARRKLLTTLRTQMEAEGLDVKIDEANGVLRLTENAVRFDADKSDLVDRANSLSRSNVGKIARVLERVLPAYVACRMEAGRSVCRDATEPSVETVFIEGHTDTTGVRDPEERDRRNWQLSTERSVNTYREIVARAPSLRSFRNTRSEEIVSVSGYAATRPIDPATTTEAWARNRRIDLRFVMEVDARQRLTQIINLTDAMKVEIDRLISASGRRQ